MTRLRLYRLITIAINAINHKPTHRVSRAFTIALVPAKAAVSASQVSHRFRPSRHHAHNQPYI